MGVFTMPSLGADMESGRIVEWLVQPGDKVHRGDVVAVVDTTKAAIEVEVFEDGTVTELLVQPGTEVEVGTPLATIAAEVDGLDAEGSGPEAGGSGSEAEEGTTEPRRRPHEDHLISRTATPPVRHLAHQLGVNLESLSGSGPHGKITRDDVQAASRRDETETGAQSPVPGVSEPAARRVEAVQSPKPKPQPEASGRAEPEPVASASSKRSRATPRARRLAVKHGIDLSSVTGTGADGALTGPDVEQAVAAQESAAKVAGGSDRKASRRAATAALMARSAREIPHYYVSQTIDLTRTLDWLRSHNAKRPVRERVLPAALFLRATVLAAQKVEELNGHWTDNTFIPADGVQLGVAVAMRDGGLLTPVIIDAQLLGLDELMARLTDLVRRARSGRLRSREIEPGSITVSSLADHGPDALFGVIYPPQVALVGIGGVAERPWAIDGALAARSTVTLTVAADHRATDGRIGADFLAELSSALTRPEEM